MEVSQLGNFMLIAIISMAVCMAITPLMMRIAPDIGMVDKPDKRKVHIKTIPRAGGIGIVLGLLIPLLIWLEPTRLNLSFFLGSAVLLFFGAWDDIKNISPKIKFIGQIIAALVVVYYGELYVSNFPFLGLSELPSYIGQPFTVIAIVGMVNALNLSDGLDGLAGGEALISLMAIAYMSFLYGGADAVAITAATIGGIFGFLRFNSHPARIFMGDAGSQTLGFVLGFMVVYLSQEVNPVISPVVALLLLGLPVIDSLIVFYLRAKRGDSLVVAAKDHLHHRLLALGFYHYESVVIIYSIQILFIICAVLFPYETDYLLFGIYLSTCFIIFYSVSALEKMNWVAHSKDAEEQVLPIFLSELRIKYQRLSVLPFRALDVGLSLFIISASMMSTKVPIDIGVSSLFLLILLLVVIVYNWLGVYLYRVIMFTTIGFSVYLLSTYPPSWLLGQIGIVYVFFSFMSIAAFITARIDAMDQFQITPLDYLVILIAVVAALAPGVDHGSTSLVWMAIQMVILFYSCELLVQNMTNRFNSFTSVAAVALAFIAIRGVL